MSEKGSCSYWNNVITTRDHWARICFLMRIHYEVSLNARGRLFVEAHYIHYIHTDVTALPAKPAAVSLLTEAHVCLLFIEQCNYIGILLLIVTSCVYTGGLHWHSCTSVAMSVHVLLHKQGNRRLKSIQIFSYIQTDTFTSTF